MSIEDIQKAIREAEANNDLPPMPEAEAATSAVGEGESLTVEFPPPQGGSDPDLIPPAEPVSPPSFEGVGVQDQTSEMVSLLRELVEITRRGFNV